MTAPPPSPPDPLSDARQRGLLSMKNVLDEPSNLSTGQVAQSLGISEQAVEEMSRAGWVYALSIEGDDRGTRYPEWQLNALGHGSRLRFTVLQLQAKNLSCWAIHMFMTSSHQILGGTAVKWIVEARRPLIEIGKAIDRYFSDSDQGAD